MESKKHKKTNKEKDNNKPKANKNTRIVPAVGGDNTFSEAKAKQTKKDKTVPAVRGKVAPVGVTPRILISPLPDLPQFIANW